MAKYDEIKGLTVQIGADTTDLSAALRKFDTSLGKSSKELREINRLLRLDPSNTEALAQKQAVLANAIQTTKDRLNALREAEQEVQEKAARGELGEDQVREFRREILSAEQALRSLEDQYAAVETAANDAGKEIKAAGEDSGKAAENTEKLKDQVDGLKNAYDEAKASAKDALQDIGKNIAGGVAGVAAVGGAALAPAMSEENALASLQAQTGADDRVMSSYRNVIAELYQSGYGEDRDDLANTLSAIVQTTNELDPSKLQQYSENALVLRDVFGFDIPESLRAVNMLTEQFGVTSEEAFNLIVQGAQAGLNKNGDLLDTINEYGVHYRQLGFSADEFFGSLENGAAAGTFSVDKLGDAMKEFGIRVKDNSSTTAESFLQLGYAAEDSEEAAGGAYASLDDLQARFAAGGAEARGAMQEVLDKLFALDDQVLQNQIGVGLFGTMWEDLGIDGVRALTNVQTSIRSTKSAMEEMKSVKYSTVANEWKALGRTVQTELITPLGNKLLPTAKRVLGFVTENLDGIISLAKTLGKVVAGAFIGNRIGAVVSSVVKLVKAYNELKDTASAANLAMNSNAIGIAITALGALVGLISSAVDRANEAAEAQKRLGDSYREAAEAALDAQSDRATAALAIQEEYDRYRDLVDELDSLVDANGRVKDANEERVGIIVGDLSEATGIEIELVDGVIQKYDELAASIDNVILKRQADAYLSSRQGDYDAAKGAIQDQTTDEDGNYTPGSLAAYETANQRYQLAVFDRNAYSDQYIAGSGTSLGREYDALVGNRERFEELRQAHNLENSVVSTEEYESELAALQMWENTYAQHFDKEIARLKENRDNAALAYDENLATVAQYDALQSAMWADDAPAIADALGAATQGLMTAESASLESLEAQRDRAAQDYQDFVQWSKEADSHITGEQLEARRERAIAATKEYYKSSFREMNKYSDEQMSESFTAMFEELTTKYDLTTQEALRLLRQVAGESYSIGASFGEGFGNGIDSCRITVQKKSRAIAQSAIDPLREELRVRSPSRVTYDIGRNTGKGLELGLEDEQENVWQKAAGLAKGVVSILSDDVSAPAMLPPEVAFPSGKASGRVADGVAINDIYTKLDAILRAVNAIDPCMVLDDGVLVARTAPQTDAALGRISERTNRGKLA